MKIELKARGFPIRRFTDQSLFAAPRNISQRTTSFIASRCQGIHQTPLSRLIVLIINVHPACGSLRRQTNFEKRPVSFLRFVLSEDAVRHPRPRRVADPASFSSHKFQDKSLLHNVNEQARCDAPGKIVMGREPRPLRSTACLRSGGARRNRTDDLKLAKLALSQLSYGPAGIRTSLRRVPIANAGNLGCSFMPLKLDGERDAQMNGGPGKS
jgi:hypothetical protein